MTVGEESSARARQRTRIEPVRMSTNAAPPLAPGAALRWAVVRPTVERLRPRTILELGCGGGAFGARLVRLAGSYTAVEPDETSWRLAYERIAPLGGAVIHGDHTKLPDGRTFDVVCAFEVLEHLFNDEAALAEWVPLVRPGGHLVLSVPAGPERMGAWDEAVGHYRRYSVEQISARLVAAGCHPPQVRFYGWPVGYLLEAARNRIAARNQAIGADTAEERSASSGRRLQPTRRLTGAAVRLGTAPFEVLQRVAPRRGIALVAVARRPD
jgi:SAM-dependent methyltransferase